VLDDGSLSVDVDVVTRDRVASPETSGTPRPTKLPGFKDAGTLALDW